MRIRAVALLPLVLVASSSQAGPPGADLKVDIQAPGGVLVYDTSAYVVVVTNIGKKPAAGVFLDIALPTTHTSPQVYILGDLGAFDSRCALTPAGTGLRCALGSLAKGAGTTVAFDIDFPQSSQPLVVGASATTSSGDGNPGNNSDSDVAALLHHSVPLAGGELTANDHCTGTNLTSFYECALFPSSISSHDTRLNAGGSITFVDPPSSYTGIWWQPTSERLRFSYHDGAVELASFDGWGTSPTCFEGITTFPGSPYVAPYSVCIVP